MKPMTDEAARLGSDALPVDKGVIACERGRETDTGKVDSEGVDKCSVMTSLHGVATNEGAETNAESDNERIQGQWRHAFGLGLGLSLPQLQSATEEAF
jgi:hypothetical protein